MAFKFVLAVLLFVAIVEAIDRDKCAADIRGGLKNGTLNVNNHTLFWDVPNLLDTKVPLSLTVRGCQSQCGGFTWYTGNEIANRIVGWLIPVLVLTGNLHMPPMKAIWKVFSLLHLLGDPIDSMLSLQHTLAVRQAAYNWAKETTSKHALDVSPADLSSVFWAFEQLDADAERTPIDVLTPLLHLREFPFAVAEAAADIRNTTVKEAARTYLAMVIYLSTITSAFIHASSSAAQCATRPGNRIAFAMLNSWLVPAVLLSTFGSRFTTSDACIRAIKRFTRHLNRPETSLLPHEYNSHIIGGKEASTQSVEDAAPYSGSIYVFRPRKPLFSANLPHYRSPIFMLLLAILPNVISASFAVAISYSTPTVGLGCRAIAQLSITISWFTSFLITITLSKLKIATGRYHIFIVFIKDLVIGGGAVLAIAIIYAGAFNSCWCWSSGLNGLIEHNLHVLLGVEQKLQQNADSIYPGLVGGGLAAQGLVFAFMWGGGWTERWTWNSMKQRGRGRKQGESRDVKYRPLDGRMGIYADLPLVKLSTEVGTLASYASSRLS